MRILAVFILIITTHLHATEKEWFKADDVHLRNDTYIGHYYQGKKNTAIIELRKDCFRAGNHLQYYSCYNLGLIFHRTKKSKQAEKVLKRALDLNPYFVPALNLMIQMNLDLPHKMSEIKLWQQAQFYAKKKMRTQLIIVMRELANLQFPAREIIDSSKDFKWINKSAEFKKILKKFPTAKVELEQLLLAGQMNNPLITAVDLRYNRKLHNKKPDKERVLYWWFNAQDLSKKGKVKAAVSSMKNFQVLLEQISVKHKSELLYLPIYAYCFMLQSNSLARIKKSKAFKDWATTQGKRLNISQGWIKIQLEKS